MTITNTHCKDIKKQLLGSSADPLDGQATAEIQEHLSHCETCQQYHSDLLSIRKGISYIQTPQLDSQLAEKTRLLCHNRFADRQRQAHPASFPLLVKVALPVIVALTVVWIALTLPASGSEESLTKPAFIGIVLLFQNGLMLLLAPLLISGFKQKNDETKFSFR